MILRIVEDFDFDLEDREDRYMEGLHYESLHGIVHDESMKFRLSPSDVTTMPDDKLAWFELLNEGADDVFHFFQQLGFGRSIIRTELKRLSCEEYDHENDTNNHRLTNSDTPLRDFYDHYPIVYDCIQASFARIPSNSRLGEMGHSFSRTFYTSQTPMTRMDHNLNFLIKHTYPQRKKRRGIGKSSKKHLDSKAKQSKSGEQVRLVANSKYSFEAMKRLPEDVQKEAQI